MIILQNVCHDTVYHRGRSSRSAWKGFCKASSMILYLLRVKLVNFVYSTLLASIQLLCCKTRLTVGADLLKPSPV